MQRIEDLLQNKLGQTIVVKKNTGTSAFLTNDAVITTDTKFKRLHADGQYNVFSITGSVPTDGKKSEQKQKKTGGYSGGNDSDLLEYKPEGNTENTWSAVANHLVDMTMSKVKQRADEKYGTPSNGTLPTGIDLATVSFMYWLEHGGDAKRAGLAAL